MGLITKPRLSRPSRPESHAERRAFRSGVNPTEALAIDRRLFGGSIVTAESWGLTFEVPEECVFNAECVLDGGIAVLRVAGPLEHHASWWWSSYEDLVSQVELALADGGVRALVLRIDSPGGVVAGMGEANRALRRIRAQYGKPLYAYVDEQACSAAYHVACACDEIWGPEACVVGSVGVICCTIDETAALERAGYSVRYVVTGERKADMHPGQPVTDEVLRVAQEKVDYLGGLFFKAVSRSRGLAPAFVKGLQAAVFHGPKAVETGLADGVASWPKFLDTVRSSIGATVSMPARAAQMGGRASSTAHPDTKRTRAMAKILKLTKAYDDAKARVSKAQSAFASASGGEKKGAMKALETAIREKMSAKEALGAAQGKSTTTRHVKHEEKVVEREEDTDSGEEAEEQEPEPEEDSEVSSTGGSEASATGSESEEEEAEEAALAKAYDCAEKAFRKSVEGHPAAQSLALHSPSRLRRLGRQVTGQSSVKGIFGALDGIGQRLAASDKTAARVEKLEQRDRASRVEAMIAKASAEGRLVGKARVEAARADGVRFGTKWLKGHLATLPKLVRSTVDGELLPRAGADGGPVGAPSADVQKMLAEATAGMSPEEAAKFQAKVMSTASTRMNGATPSH